MKISIWNNLSEAEKSAALARPVTSICESMIEKVKTIIKRVKVDGDQTLLDLTQQFDQAKLANLKVSPAEFKRARSSISDDAKKAIEFAKSQLEKNHSSQLPSYQIIETCEGVVCERQVRPIDCVGLYIPGGSAPLVSTALMLGVPAKLANSRLRIMCSPPNEKGEIDPHILSNSALSTINCSSK